MTFRLLISLLFASTFSMVSGQIIEDDFTDSDITTNPVWKGDVNNFIVQNGVLQLNDSDAGASSLFSNYTIGDSTSWEFWFNLDFDPSASNALEVYLLSTTENLETGDAYFLRIGENGTEDPIRLIMRIGNVETEIASSSLGIAATKPEMTIKAVLSADQKWSFQYRNNQGSGYLDLFELNVNELINPGEFFFGFSCSYTSTRKDKFFFDNIKVGAILPDMDAPYVENLIIENPSQLRLIFNEDLAVSSINNLLIDWKGSYPGNTMASIDNILPNELKLSLDPALTSPNEFMLNLKGVTDLSNNNMIEYDSTFSFFLPEQSSKYDIIITEIMADPSPAIGLPDAEYFELYNRSDKVLDLSGYTISSGSSVDILPSFILEPEQYVLVIDRDFEANFSFLNNKVLVDGLFTLSNNGDDINLFNPNGELIHSLNYNIHWYNSDTRSDGGYSLEMISFNNVCKGISNWSACMNLLGGTPGRINSVFDDTRSVDGPQLVSAETLASDTLLVSWDRAIDQFSLAVNQFSIQNIGISDLTSEGVLSHQIKVILLDEIDSGQIYILTVLEDFIDCIGNANPNAQEVSFAIPEKAEPGDLVINEILSDPYPNSSDFIEVLNLSDKVISFDQLAFRNAELDETVIIETGRSIFPGEYFVFSDDINSLSQEYLVQNPQWLIESKIPRMNNESGNIQLGFVELFGLSLIDEMDYDTDMHSVLLDDTEGVSLEKIISKDDGLNADNWHSASAEIGYATPCSVNSQYLDPEDTNTSDIFLSSKRISPDQDGYEDFILLNYNLDKAGYKVNAEIYSDRGIKILSFAQDLLLGTQGSLKWEGNNEEGNKPPMGIYLISVELVHPDGDIISKKLPCIVASPF